MKFSLRALVPVLALVAACAPTVGISQTPAQQPQPEVRYLTVTRFQLPQDTAQQRLLMMAIDSVWVPQARMNPHVLSFRMATHSWGANSNEALFIYEYPNWAAIEAECEACDQWLEAQRPAQGTPERARWDAMTAAFGAAYSGHSDEIYAVQMRRAKE